MSNIDAVNALITAINFDRFAEIEARHNPDVVFSSFRGPTLNSSVAVEDWHRTFLRDYADCNYTDLEYIEQGETVAVRGTIEAKGYDWRPFTQRVVEVFEMVEGGVQARRMYGMLPDVEFDKPTAAAMTNAVGFKGGSASTTASLLTAFYSALAEGDKEKARESLADKAVLIDSVYGTVNGPDNVLDLKSRIPVPAFGVERVVHSYAGEKDGLVEIAIDPARPRLADWVRIVDGKILVIESYWMLREIGVHPDPQKRHQRQVIMPM